MPYFTVGLDLGQAKDYSALCVVEHVLLLPPGSGSGGYVPAGHPELDRTEHHFRVRYLHRWELGTPYPAVVAEAARIMSGSILGPSAQLMYDSTGVGRAVGDLLHQEWRGNPEWLRMPWPVDFTPATKAAMSSAVLLALQSGRLHVAAALPLAPVLESELARFRQRIRSNGATAIEVDRGDGHGDLATALLVALRHGDWLPGYVQAAVYDGDHRMTVQ